MFKKLKYVKKSEIIWLSQIFFVPLRYNKQLKGDKIMTCFEIETIYKSGRKRNEAIVSSDEESMWKYYDKHHNKNLVDSSTIVDAWAE